MKLTSKGNIATLLMDMPDRSANVWNQQSLDSFKTCLELFIQDDSLSGLIISSAKKSFLAGGDLEQIKSIASGQQSAAELHAKAGALSELLRRLETCGKPVVAAINGTALGGGFELCLACHHRLIVPSAKVGLPESQLGLIPAGGGTQRLPRLIGVQGALGLLMKGNSLGAEQALKVGIVDAIVDDDELLDAAADWLRQNPQAKQPWDGRGFEVPGGDMSGSGRNTIMVATAMFQAKTFGNYPAGTAILSCIAEGLRLPMDAALAVEKRYFVSLLLDPVAGAMVRSLYLDLEAAKKGARRPSQVAPNTVTDLGIIGAGLMGSGIALVAARQGLNVVVIDRSDEETAKAHVYVDRFFAKRIAKGRATQDEAEAVKGRIRLSTDYAALSDSQIIIEAVFEDRQVKAQVSAAAEAAAPNAVIASNTSTLPITGLAKAVSKPQSFIGLHFFSPVERMALVEVIRGEETSDEALAMALDLVAKLGKVPVVVNDARGFFTSRVFGTYITEGVGMLSEGVAPALIEQAGLMSGMPMAPLSLADEVGLSLMHQVGQQTKADLGDDYKANAAAPVLAALVEQGRHGKANSSGFYDYPESDAKRLWGNLGDLYPSSVDQPSVEGLKKRFLYTQALEALRCVEEGVMVEAADVDYAAIMGWGFAPFTGGPLSMIDQLGAAKFLEECEYFAATLGERFEPPALLRELAKNGNKLRP
jgi:3-hydroxyacyl-CoA dehydrogenase/enoyl-CoA hydratase/3-hydroxybutyryl-CoA epimerase